MTGTRAYCLVDVLKQINDQSTPTVETTSTEVVNLLVGSAAITETIALRDQVTLALGGTTFVWGPAGSGQTALVWNLSLWS